eukprot:Hpha_TRINITY_DN16427_c1_g1::TRINITY_DN16427_c1_g1_i1::g.163436::m.163436/K09699/DBT, bkdB; 2-oxoisovalerate dehydrogenase E2 component (dihydrolipoyl transacylase)
MRSAMRAAVRAAVTRPSMVQWRGYPTMTMAAVGDGINEVELVSWKVKEGDAVTEGQPLCEVQSDKATVEVTAEFAGTVTKVYTPEGSKQQVGQPLIDIGGEGGAAAAAEEEAPAEPAAPAPKKKKPAKKAGGGVTTMKMADVGEGIKEVEVTAWCVAEGDTVEEFQKLCDVQSDKASVEVTSPYAGKIVKLYTPLGEKQQVGHPLVDFEVTGDHHGAEEEEVEEEAAAPAAASPAASSAASSSSGFTQSAAGKKVLSSPKVRREAREKGIDLTLVKGTGGAGRVTAEDLANFIKQQSAKPAAAAAPAPAAAAGAPAAAVGDGRPMWSPEDKTVKVAGIMKKMVESMTDSLTIPVFHASDEVNMNALIEARAALKPLAEQRGVKLSLMPFFIKATSLALKQFPVLNTTMNADATELLYRGQHNIGIAMDTPVGLIVPNIKDVQSKSILEIGQDLNGLQERGKNGKLTMADLSGGTFTLSNIGPIGGTYVTPIIFQRQGVIGAFGKTTKLPRYDDKGNVVPVSTMYITWTADHRMIDGATMVRYSNLFKSYLENPAAMLLETA